MLIPEVYQPATVCFVFALLVYIITRNISDDQVIAWWRTWGRAMYPMWLTQSKQNLISFCFWHSMFWTVNVPIASLWTTEWTHGAHTPTDVVMLVTGKDHASVCNYNTSETSSIAFFLHATCGLSWLLTSYVEFVWLIPSPQKGGKAGISRWHRRFGYFSALALFCHLAAASFTVYADVAREKPLNKIIFGTSVISIAFAFKGALVAAMEKKTGWYLQHQDNMIYMYLLSITGAGNIRQIGFIQELLGVGPAVCAKRHMSCLPTWDGPCAWHSTLRLCLIGLWTSLMHGAYVAHRRSDKVTLLWWNELKTRVVGSLVILGLSYVPGSLGLIDAVLGAHRSIHGDITFWVVMVAYAYSF